MVCWEERRKIQKKEIKVVDEIGGWKERLDVWIQMHQHLKEMRGNQEPVEHGKGELEEQRSNLFVSEDPQRCKGRRINQEKVYSVE